MSGKTYAVTGVASGIGAELAAILRGCGHRVIGFDVVDAAETVDRFIPLDLSDEISIDAAIAALDEDIDGLCNNAGLPPREGLLTKILQVNYLGQRRFTRGVLGRVRSGGALVNMASRAGRNWPEGLEQVKRLTALASLHDAEAFAAAEDLDPVRAYDLTKEAMIVWTMAENEGLLAKGLRINSISPGAVATNILDDFARAFGDRMHKNVARAGRAGEAREIAAIAAFLLSPESEWIKGVDIGADGGMSAFNASDALGLADLRL